MNIGIITGTGFYDFDEIGVIREAAETTPYGPAVIASGTIGTHAVHFIARHGKNHRLLPNMINYRANICALKKKGVQLILATSVMGILDPDIPLAAALLFKDLFYPDNRLPGGEICTVFTKEGGDRGHYIFGSPFSSYANTLARESAASHNIPLRDGLVHGHANGPRFNSKAEIAMLRSAACATVSQTVGPEIILAGELNMAYCLLGFGVDYANGVSKEPTPVEALNDNIGQSGAVFKKLIRGVMDTLDDDICCYDGGFVYRFE
jgi:5'-methylthioadenosine phosphorylase